MGMFCDAKEGSQGLMASWECFSGVFINFDSRVLVRQYKMDRLLLESKGSDGEVCIGLQYGVAWC